MQSYKSALEQAKKSGRVLLLMVSQEGCPMCTYMKNNTLKAHEVSRFIAAHFIFAEVESVDETLPEKYEAFVTPTFFFIDPKSGEKVGEPLRGGFKPDAFLRILKMYENEYNKQKGSEND